MKKIFFILTLMFLIPLSTQARINCDDLLPIKGISKEECDLCPNREFLVYHPYWMMEGTDTSCSLRECPTGYMSADDMFEVKEALDLVPFKTKMGDHHEWGKGCFPCDEPFFLRVSEEECNKCQNRKYYNGLCGFRNCPDETPLLTEFGGCVRCGTVYRVIAGCEKCEDDPFQLGCEK